MRTRCRFVNPKRKQTRLRLAPLAMARRIALHGGALPGYPASHGCVRMPFDFAEQLFDMTRMGLRVIVAPTDVAPVEIVHPALSMSKPVDGAMVAARMAEKDDAARKADLA